MEFRVQLVNNSTAITAVAHNLSQNMLRVTFRSGMTYDYQGVDEETFDQLRNAESVGRVFNRVIRPIPAQALPYREGLRYLNDVISSAPNTLFEVNV